MKKAKKVSSKTNKSAEPETISELARRHMTDQNHTTTDEELLNAKVELTENVDVDKQNLYEVDHETIIPPLPGENKEDFSEGANKRHLPNPYDVLEE